MDVDDSSEPVNVTCAENWHMGASAATKINRQDFGVSADKGMVGDEIPIMIDVELVHTPPPVR